MNELEKLAARCEAATADEQHKLLYEAFDAIFGFVSRNMALKDIPEGALARQVRFSALMGSRAHIDAAMMLVPEGLGWNLYSDGFAGVGPVTDYDLPQPETYASTPALALCAAALRAQQGAGR